MKLRRFIKKLASLNQISNFIFIHIYLYILYLYSLKPFYKFRSIKVYKMGETLKLIDTKSKKTCHIIGSGWSLNYSKNRITQEGFVIGFNFAAISDLVFDLYVIEVCSNKSRRAKELSDSLSSLSSKLFNVPIIVKNLYFGVDPKYLYESWSNLCLPVYDIHVPCFSDKYLKTSIKILFEDNTIFLRQLNSTTITSIALAYRLGFKKIIVHGLDFGGPYFFDSDSFEGSFELRPSYEICKKYEKNERHYTARAEVAIEKIMEAIKIYLNENGVEIFSATKDSPLSKILPVAVI